MQIRLFVLLLSLTVFAHAQDAVDSSLTTHRLQIPNIAIVPFTGDNSVTAEQLNFITGKFSSELNETHAFTILDRGKMEFILKEQGFQQLGACSSSECKVQIGQLLGVDKIVGGSLVRFGKKYAFRAEYIDVGSGQMLFSAEWNESGEIEDVYESICRNAALQLANKERGISAPVIKAPQASPTLESSSVTQVPLLAPVVDTLAASLPALVADTSLRASRPAWKLPVVIALAASSIVCGVLGYQANSTMKTERSKYNDAVFPDASHADAQWQKAADAQNKRNILYGIAGGILAAGLTVQLAF